MELRISFLNFVLMKRYKIKEVTYLDGSKGLFFYVQAAIGWNRLYFINTMEELEEYLKRRRDSIVIDTKTTYLNDV